MMMRAVGVGIAFFFDFALRNLRGYFVDVAGRNSDILAATAPSGAMARPTRMEQAMSPPMVISPSEMRYTPQMMTPQ